MSPVTQLTIQMVGTLFISGAIAYLTVLLSLRRFRREKIWEQKLNSFVDVTVALNEMLLSLGKWIDQEIDRQEYTEEFKKNLRDRYQDGRKKLERVHALSKLLLSIESSTALDAALEGIEKADTDDWFDDLNKQYSIIEETIEKIAHIGRIELKISGKTEI